MFTPNFTDPQFVDAAGQGGLNTAFGNVSGSIGSLGLGLFTAPGLIAPEVMALSYAGLTGTVTLSQPWALVTSGGVLVRPHGTQTGQDTNTYAFDFTSLVPGTGTVSGWLACSGIVIQQGIVPIPGPPPGHPSWNPNFVPTIGYSSNVYSVAVFPTTTAPDNITIFGLFSANLTAGAGVLNAISMGTQVRAGLLTANQLIGASPGNLTVANAQFILIPTTTNQTNTLPLAATARWLTFRLLNNAGSPWTIAAQGGDVIAGFTVNSSVVTSLTLNQYDFIDLYATDTGTWYIDGTLPQRQTFQVFSTRQSTPSVNYKYTFPTGPSSAILRLGGTLSVPYNGASPNTYNFPSGGFTSVVDNAGVSFYGSAPQPWGAGIEPISKTQFQITIPTAGSSAGPYAINWWAEGV